MDFKKLLTNPIFWVSIVALATIVYLTQNNTFSGFKQTLVTPQDQLDQTGQPQNFPKLSATESGGIKLSEPVVPEEIGLAMVYPQGKGVGMSKNDSNSFLPGNPESLLTDHTTPESFGESSLADPSGANGANEGARILKIKNAGSQIDFKPADESMNKVYAQAYNDGGEVPNSAKLSLINGTLPVDYKSTFKPEGNMNIQASPGQESKSAICETTYPNTVKYNDFCITEGDIPYGKVINNKVNPRLVSRWESFTGNYSREAALEPIDGLLYPDLKVPL